MRIVKIFHRACTISALACFAVTPLSSAIANELQPNFVTIVIDDMGYSDLGAFGSEISTPHLDQLAGDGIMLNNFYASSTSSPSRAMLFSGKDNHAAGLGAMHEGMREEQKGQPGYEGILSLDVLPFPQLLQDNGYHTMMVGKWHMGDTEPYYAHNRGFTETRALLLPGGDMNFMTNANGEFVGKKLPDRQSAYTANGAEANLAGLPANTQTSVYYTEQAIDMLNARDVNKPFYLNMSYTAPHTPWQAPKERAEQYHDMYYQKGYEVIRAERFKRLQESGLINPQLVLPPMPEDVPAWDSLSERSKQIEARRMAVYAGMIDVLDENVGRLIQHLKDINQYENTVFLIYSDNGGEIEPIFVRPQFTYNLNNEKYAYELGKSEQVDSLPAADFQALIDNLGGSDSYIGPNKAWSVALNTPFNKFKADTFEGGVHTSAFLHYPQAKAKGIKYNCLQSVMDIAPTILDMANIAYPETFNGKPNPPMHGVSMENLFNGQLYCNPERWLGFEVDGVKGLRAGNWKLSMRWNEPDIYMFNVWQDPFETTDLKFSNPEKFVQLLSLYEQYATENQVLAINPLILPDLADANTTAAKIRGGSSKMGGNFLDFRANASIKSHDSVHIAGEIRPDSAHLGKPAAIYAYGSYTIPALAVTFYFSVSASDGLLIQDSPEAILPYKHVEALPQLITIPVYEGPLIDAGNIEMRFGYTLAEATFISNADNPLTLTVGE